MFPLVGESGCCQAGASWQHAASAADRLEIPAAEICLFLSLLQQQLEAGAGPCFLPPLGSLCLPSSFVDYSAHCCLHAAITFFSFPFPLSISCCISFALHALLPAMVVPCW